METVLPYIEFPTNGLASLGHLGLIMRNGGPEAEYCSWANLDLGLGEDGPLAVCRIYIYIYIYNINKNQGLF